MLPKLDRLSSASKKKSLQGYCFPFGQIPTNNFFSYFSGNFFDKSNQHFLLTTCSHVSIVSKLKFEGRVKISSGSVRSAKLVIYILSHGEDILYISY